MRQKSLNEIVHNIINNIHDALPEVDTKQGTFIRDVFINPVSDEIAAMYVDMKVMELSQSILTASGNDLDKLAANYFVTRKPATPSYGKLRFYLKNTNKILVDDELPLEVEIIEGTIVSTLGSLIKDPIQVKTTERLYITRDRIKDLPVDSNNGYRFVEIAAKSLENGYITNVGAGELTEQITNINFDIAFISNPFSFTGGTDQEDDASLAFRINLAISGSNIGTRDGYLSYILKQNGVIDARIVSAGEPLMYRDGGHIGPDGTYIPGLKGGMVDIYVRGEQNDEEEWNFVVDEAYLSGSKAFRNIVLPKQPVNNISEISYQIDNVAYKVFVNASNYEIEKGTIEDEDGNTINTINYYKDTEWDFSITDKFTDEYALIGVNEDQEIETLRKKVNAELKEALNYMTNINYSLNWSLMNKNGPVQGLFKKVLYNDRVYQIIAVDPRLDGRTFVKKNDRIYIRTYKHPDYKLRKDLTPIGNSIKGQDSIEWILGGEKPIAGSTLNIKYNYDSLIHDLQKGIDYNKILTADVLVKKATELPIEVMVELVCSNSYEQAKIKTDIINAVTRYIDNIKKMGGEFDRSDIAAIVRQIPGVESVDLSNDSLKISVLGFEPKKTIVALDNEYFKLRNIIVNIRTS